MHQGDLVGGAGTRLCLMPWLGGRGARLIRADDADYDEDAVAQEGFYVRGAEEGRGGWRKEDNGLQTALSTLLEVRDQGRLRRRDFVGVGA